MTASATWVQIGRKWYRMTAFDPDKRTITLEPSDAPPPHTRQDLPAVFAIDDLNANLSYLPAFVKYDGAAKGEGATGEKLIISGVERDALVDHATRTIKVVTDPQDVYIAEWKLYKEDNAE